MQTRRPLPPLGLLTLAALLAAPLAHAYTLTGARWQRNSLPVTFKVNYASSRELGQATTQQVVEASFGAWSTPSCSSFRWTNLGSSASGGASSSDNQNLLVWRYDAWPAELGGASTIGVTTPAYYPGASGQQGTMIDADIQFNGINYTWSTNPRRQSDVDAQSIITHETGHFLGLGHSNSAAATMYYAYSGGTASRSLEADDVSGVCTLYPTGAGTECSATRACASGATCQNGYCIASTPDGGAAGGGFGADCAAATATCDQGFYCVCSDQAQTQCNCTRDCGTTAPCPNGWSCAPLQGGGGACVPASASGGGAGPLGSACTSGNDCANGYCVGSASISSGTCSQPCNTQSPCPSGYRCAALQGGGGACVAGGTTTTDGGAPPAPDAGTPQGLGARCAAASECRSGYCASSSATERVCSQPCQAQADCPSGYACRSATNGATACFVGSPPPEPEADAGATPEDPGASDGGASPPSAPSSGPRGGCAAGGEDLGSLWMLAVASLFGSRAARRRRS